MTAVVALQNKISLALLHDLQALGQALHAAGHGERGGLLKDFMDRYGWSDENRVYRHLKAVGWTSGRKRRADAGATAMTDAAIESLGATTRLGIRENGKQTMPVTTAMSVLGANHLDIPVGAGRVRTLLRRHHLSTAAARQDAPHTAMRSLHPNHLHEVDPSLCLLYYTPDGGQQVLHDSEIYKNKPQWAEKVGNLKCWRYVLTDHYSGVVICRYYQAAGENQANLYDFLLYCWRQLDHIDRPVYGVPLMLVWDKGSANQSGAIKNALRALDVRNWAHAKGQSRAKGQVENGNNLVETHFECRLKYQPVRDIAALNTAAEHWYQAWNANAIPHQDSRLHRAGLAQPLARYALWSRITGPQKRLLPDDATCRYLLSAEPEERLVRSTAAGGLSIQFAHPVSKRSEYYDLARVPGVVKGMKVQVSPLIYGDHQVLVTVADYQGNETHHVVDPVAWDESGQRADAPVWGERFRSNPDTPAEKAAKAAEARAFPGLDREAIDKAKSRNAVPFGGTIDAHTHLAEVYRPAYLDRPGTALEIESKVQVRAKILDPTELCLSLMQRLGIDWQAEMGAEIFSRHPQGAEETELPALADWLSSGEWQAGAVPADTGRPKLVAVK